jgi:hypothetical protein
MPAADQRGSEGRVWVIVVVMMMMMMMMMPMMLLPMMMMMMMMMVVMMMMLLLLLMMMIMRTFDGGVSELRHEVGVLAEGLEAAAPQRLTTRDTAESA